MNQSLINLINHLQAWFCFHALNIPLPFFLPRRYQEKLKIAQAHLLKIRHETLTPNKPRPHVIHVFHPKGKAKGKILVTHGWMSKSVFMIGIIDTMVTAGYSVYAIDFPAHGDSKGIKLKWLDSVQSIIEAQKNYGPFDGAIGHSYGGSMLLCTFCLNEHFHVPRIPKIALIASPTNVTSPVKMAARRLRLSRDAYRLFRRWMRREHDVDLKLIKPYEKACQGDTKFLVLHGKQDSLIPPIESIRFCHQNPNAQLLMAPNLNHNNILFSESTYESLVNFIVPT